MGNKVGGPRLIFYKIFLMVTKKGHVKSKEVNSSEIYVIYAHQLLQTYLRRLMTMAEENRYVETVRPALRSL